LSDCVGQAFECAELNSHAVVLLGIEPARPEPEYGWIEPGEPLMASGPSLVFGVRRFWEKPSRVVAIELMRRGCFWNSFIMVGRVGSFLDLVGRAAPHLFRSFQAIAPTFFTKREEASVLNLYMSIPSGSFAEDVLSACPGNLAVLCSRTLEWADVGDVGRAISLMRFEKDRAAAATG
ncbi:MAG: sugar phosphate nucleotidyltransferase, partial [Bryobacteraceae bacterium]